MILNFKTLAILFLILILIILGFTMILMFFKQKSKPCIECGTITKKGKICSKCGISLINKKAKIFLIIGLSSMLLALISCTFFKEPNSVVIFSQSNERNYSLLQLIVDTDYINIRESNSVNSDILGKVNYGEIYTIISEDDLSEYNWYEIETSTGIRGYIAGKSNGTSYVKLLEVNNIVDNEEIKDIENNEAKEEENKNHSNQSNINNNSTNKPNHNHSSVNNNNNNNNESTSKPNENNNSTVNNNESLPSVDTNEEETQEPIQPEKKQIAATKEYYCSSFSYTYSASTKTCSKESYTTDESIRKVVCPEGYEPGTGVLCEDKTERDTVIEPTETTTCSTGSSNLYYIDGQYGCRTGYLTPFYSCPSGYKLTYTTVGSVSVRRCVWNKASTVKGYYTCNNGYKLDSRNLCYKKIIKDADVKYSCPAGYTLQNDMCYEN